MSSLVRTIQKRILKDKMGLMRQKTEVRVGATGRPYLHALKKGEGPIVDFAGNEYGQRWPTSWPAPITKEATN